MAARVRASAALTPAATRPALKMGSVSDGPTTENRPWGPNVWPFSVRLLGDGRVQILLWNRPGLGERPVAGDVPRCFLQIGLALIELGPEAIDHGDSRGRA
jgi:hypothetical protein